MLLSHYTFYIPSEISAIEKESCDLKDCCQRLMTRWLDTNCGCTPKTWQTLLKCIKDVEELTAAAEEINIALSMCICICICNMTDGCSIQE